MYMLFKKVGTILIVIMASMMLTSTLGAANRDFSKIETVRIGVLGNIQEPSSIGIFNATKMAAEELNAAGGILGKKIEIIEGDTEGKTEKGINAFKKLTLSDKVDVLVGESVSGVALALQNYLPQSEIVYVAIVSSPAFTENIKKNYNQYKYSFRNSINGHRQEKWALKFLTEFVRGELGYNKIAILSENAKWAQDYAPYLKTDLEKVGMEVVFFEMFDMDVKDFSPIFTLIKSKGAQWIAEVVAWGATVPLVKSWQEIKPAPMGLVNATSMDSKFWEMTDGRCLSQVTFNFISRAPLTDKTIPFWDKYIKKYGTNPVYTTGFSYDTIYMLAEVIKQKKSVKSDDIISGLENITYKGVLHPETAFDKESHDLLEGRYVMPMVQWQSGGKQIVIWPKQFKTGNYIPPTWWK